MQPTPAPTTSRTTTTVPDYLTGGESVGAAVTATDSDSGDTVAYALGVDDPNNYYLFFDVDSSGQLTVNDAGALDYAGLAYDQVYPIVLTAEDGEGGSGSILVAVSIGRGDIVLADSNRPRPFSTCRPPPWGDATTPLFHCPLPIYYIER